MIWKSPRRRRSSPPRSRVSSTPSKRTSPALGRMSCRIALPTVVLPQPDSPTSASVRPDPMASETPSTARTWATVRFRIPLRIGKWTLSCFTSSSAAVAPPCFSAVPASWNAIGPASSSSLRWQRTAWPAAIGVQPGASAKQRSNACSQRSAKRHKGKSLVSGGTCPLMTASSAPRLPAPGSEANSLRE